MSAGQLRPPSSVPAGNIFDKYGSDHPVVRRLMSGFRSDLAALITRAAPHSILDVGCGEGVLSAEWARELGATVVGLDLADPKLEREWGARREAKLTFVQGTGEELPFGDGEFDLVAAIETLEHVSDPERVLGEMGRVAREHLLVSIPREPLWRTLNLARGAYLRRLGDTPGHVNHWSRRDLRRLLAPHGELLELRTPFPWVMALVYTG